MDTDFSEDAWNYAGNLLAASYFVGPMLAAALLAVQVVMALFQASIFFNTPKPDRQGRLFLVLVSWAILTSSTINFVLSAMGSYLKLLVGGPTGISYAQPQSDLNPNPPGYTRAAIAGDAFLCIAVAIGDIVMLWRCFELWRDKRWVVIPPGLACIGTIVSMAISLAPWTYQNAASSRIRAIIASASLSVATNIMVTGLILLRVLMGWLARRKTLSAQSTRMYSTVTGILIESAAPLAIFGICYIATTVIWLDYPPRDLRRQARLVFLRDIFNWLYYSFCALSPQMIMFRVVTGKLWRNAKGGRDDDEAFSKSIRFASGGGGTGKSGSTGDI